MYLLVNLQFNFFDTYFFLVIVDSVHIYIFILIWFLGCKIPYPKREFLTDDDQEEKSENKRPPQPQQPQPTQQATQQQHSVGADNHANPSKRARLQPPHPGQVNSQVCKKYL